MVGVYANDQRSCFVDRGSGNWLRDYAGKLPWKWHGDDNPLLMQCGLSLAKWSYLSHEMVLIVCLDLCWCPRLSQEMRC